MYIRVVCWLPFAAVTAEVAKTDHFRGSEMATACACSLLKLSSLALLGSLLVACGGGGHDTTPTPVNPPPASPSTGTFTVNVSLTGLAGSGLVLELNGSEQFVVSNPGPVTFTTKLAAGDTYSVAVHARPTDPAQSCEVEAGQGTVATADINSVSVSCSVTNSPLTLTTASLTLSLDSALNSLSGSIATIASAIDSQTLGRSLQLPASEQGFATPVLAFNSNGDVLLAGFAQAPTSTLSADSTAIAFVLLSFGILPPQTPTLAQIETDIRNAADYPALVAAINVSLGNQSSPLNSSDVITEVANVYNEIAGEIQDQISPAISHVHAVTTNPQVLATPPLPFQIVGVSKNFPTQASVFLSGRNRQIALCFRSEKLSPNTLALIKSENLA